MSKFRVKAAISNVVEIEVEAKSPAAAYAAAQFRYDDDWLAAVERDMEFDIDILSVLPVTEVEP